MIAADYKNILGIIAVLMSLYGHGVYIRGILQGITKPHIFTWIIWCLLTGIAFFAQISDNAGPGAWTMGVTAGLCVIICGLALKSGKKNITRSDLVLFLGGLAAIPIWIATKDPLWSVILISVIDASAFGPTIRKSWNKPYEEMAITFGLSFIRHAIAIAALVHVSVVTALFPATLLVMNGLLCAILLVRRQTMAKPGTING